MFCAPTRTGHPCTYQPSPRTRDPRAPAPAQPAHQVPHVPIGQAPPQSPHQQGTPRNDPCMGPPHRTLHTDKTPQHLCMHTQTPLAAPGTSVLPASPKHSAPPGPATSPPCPCARAAFCRSVASPTPPPPVPKHSAAPHRSPRAWVRPVPRPQRYRGSPGCGGGGDPDPAWGRGVSQKKTGTLGSAEQTRERGVASRPG